MTSPPDFPSNQTPAEGHQPYVTGRPQEKWRAARGVILALAAALALRVAVSAVRPSDVISDDAGFYLRTAQTTIEGTPFLGYYLPRTDPPALRYYTSVGPLYPAFLVLLMTALPEEAVLVGVRAMQIALDVLSVWLVYRIGWRLFGRRAGLAAIVAMALDLRFALQALDPSTETLYITLSVAGLALYVAAAQSERLRGFAASGALFGLAALTRPVPILLPLAFLIHALLGGEKRAHLLKGVGLLALATWAVIAPWTVRNAIVTGGEFIPVSNTAASNFWLGTTDEGTYEGHHAFYQQRDADGIVIPDTWPSSERAEEGSATFSATYVEAGLNNVLSHPFAYLLTRARNTLDAYAQPYGTVWFRGESIKQIAARWLAGEASLSDVIGTEAFWPKLLVYIFHFGALAFGLTGLALAWSRWREVLPLALILAYGTGIYAVLIVIPRYLFPLMPFFWIAGGYGIVRLWAWVRPGRAKAA